MKYNDYTPDYLTKDVLMQDDEFLGDASSFLYKRTGDVLTDPDKIYEKYLEHMRIHDVNEATTVQDLVYAERADDDSKAEMARLFHAYDKMEMFREGEGVADAFNRFTDYAEGILTAPSTWIGLFTGGAGKAGAMAGQAVAKTAVRKALVSGLTKKGAMRAAAVEGGIAAVQDVGRQATQMELSEDTGVTIREEFSPLEAGINVTLSSGLGGVLGGASAYKNAMQEATAQRRAAIGARNVTKATEEANLLATETLATAKQVVRPIDEMKVELGEAIRSEKMLSPLESTIVQLDDNIINRIHAAATEFVENIDVKTFPDGTRQPITEAIADAIGTERLGVERWNQVLERYSLTSEQFGLIFAADVSRAARLLNKQSQIARVKKLSENINTIASRIDGAVSEDSLAMYNAMPEAFAKVASTAKGFERMRRAFLTSQIQTTVRNIVGGGARVFVDAMNTFSENATLKIANALNIPTEGIQPRRGVGDIFKYMLDQQEAQVIVDAYSTQMPQDAKYLFSTFIDASDVAARTGSGGALEKFGTWVNFANRHADNYFKRAIFSGELNRLTKAKFDKDVIRMLQDGEFNKITPEMFKMASDKSLELLYQKTPKNALAKAYLDLDKMAGVGMITGLVMPFPRFVFNQIKFMTEYAPVIGMMMPGQTTSQKFAKTLTGFGMIGGFALFRSTQGPTTNYYEYQRENGQTADLRPTLAGLSIHAYLGDMLYRMMVGEPNHVDSGNYGAMVKEIQELGLGTAFRAGFGTELTDRYIPDAMGAVFGEGELDVSTARALGTMLGDYAATFAYSLPVGLARDLFQLTDEEVRQIGETREGVTFWEIFGMRSTRGLPEFMRPERSPRYEILSNIETRTEIPMAAATTGMNIQRAKNALEKEMTRLQMDAYEIYKPVPFGPADVAIRRELSKRLPRFGVEVIQSDNYKKAKTDGERKQILRDNMRNYVNVIKENAFNDLRNRIRKGEETRFTLAEVYKFEFESTGTKEDRKNFLPYFKERFGYDFNEDDPDMIEDGIIMLQDYMKAKPKVKMATGGYVTKKYAEGGFVDDNPMMLSETAAEEDPAARQQAGEKFVSEMTELGLDVAPITGEIRSAQGAVEDYEAGNYGMAALGALGSIPIVGPAVRGATKGAKKVIDAAEIFETKKIKDTVAKTKEKKKINDELRELSVKGELPEDFAGYKLNDEVDVPGIGTGRIGRVYYNNQGEAMINIATDVEDTPLVGMKVSDAVEQGVGITKPAPVKKVNVNTAKLPQQEFVISPHNQMMRDTQDSDPETYRKLMEISKDDPEGFVKHIFDYRKDKWLEKTGKTPNTEVVERNNIMQNAANKVKDGELSVEEFRKIADQHKPVKVWDTMPEMATYEDMFFALDAKKRQSPFVGYNATIPDGTRMTSRLDIPAYTNSDTWIVTLKGDYNDGKNMYTPAVRMRNVDLNQSLKNQEKALGVAAGKAKGPFAVMEGDYVEETAEDTYKLAQQALESGDWVQVGYDPTRRGFFYDRKTMEPVLAADEIVQVGPLVLAKNATKGDAKEFKFAKGGLMAKR